MQRSLSSPEISTMKDPSLLSDLCTSSSVILVLRCKLTAPVLETSRRPTNSMDTSKRTSSPTPPLSNARRSSASTRKIRPKVRLSIPDSSTFSRLRTNESTRSLGQSPPSSIVWGVADLCIHVASDAVFQAFVDFFVLSRNSSTIVLLQSSSSVLIGRQGHSAGLVLRLSSLPTPSRPWSEPFFLSTARRCELLLTTISSRVSMRATFSLSLVPFPTRPPPKCNLDGSLSPTITIPTTEITSTGLEYVPLFSPYRSLLTRDVLVR